jgi:hypothetical protein
MVVTHYHNISTKSSELSAVAGGQCHALAYVLSFCHKTRYDVKTPMTMATSKKFTRGRPRIQTRKGNEKKNKRETTRTLRA